MIVAQRNMNGHEKGPHSGGPGRGGRQAPPLRSGVVAHPLFGIGVRAGLRLRAACHQPHQGTGRKGQRYEGKNHIDHVGLVRGLDTPQFDAAVQHNNSGCLLQGGSGMPRISVSFGRFCRRLSGFCRPTACRLRFSVGRPPALAPCQAAWCRGLTALPEAWLLAELSELSELLELLELLELSELPQRPERPGSRQLPVSKRLPVLRQRPVFRQVPVSLL